MEMCTMKTIPALVFALFDRHCRSRKVRFGAADGYVQ
jgi:hypothetical protein